MNWRVGTPCAERGPEDEIWFPTDSVDAQEYALKVAETICGGCPSKALCLEYALSLPDNESHGIYAGTTREQRRRLRRNIARPSRAQEAS